MGKVAPGEGCPPARERWRHKGIRQPATPCSRARTRNPIYLGGTLPNWPKNRASESQSPAAGWAWPAQPSSRRALEGTAPGSHTCPARWPGRRGRGHAHKRRAATAGRSARRQPAARGARPLPPAPPRSTAGPAQCSQGAGSFKAGTAELTGPPAAPPRREVCTCPAPLFVRFSGWGGGGGSGGRVRWDWPTGPLNCAPSRMSQAGFSASKKKGGCEGRAAQPLSAQRPSEQAW